MLQSVIAYWPCYLDANIFKVFLLDGVDAFALTLIHILVALRVTTQNLTELSQRNLRIVLTAEYVAVAQFCYTINVAMCNATRPLQQMYSYGSFRFNI